LNYSHQQKLVSLKPPVNRISSRIPSTVSSKHGTTKKIAFTTSKITRIKGKIRSESTEEDEVSGSFRDSRQMSAIFCFSSQEQLMEALKKKKQCNEKAQKIVEKLLDPFDDEKELLLLVSWILTENLPEMIDKGLSFVSSFVTSISVTTKTS
jgi:DNA gyrase/topoisomerase IV subunit A